MNEFKPDYAVPPRYTILETLKEKGKTLSDLASDTNIDLDELVSIIDGYTPITKDIAQKLSEYFGISASFWLNLQNNYAKTLYRLCCEKAGLKPNLFAHLSDQELEALSVLVNMCDKDEVADDVVQAIKFLDSQFNEEWLRRSWDSD
jgi:addiction module HigA family antidote